MINDWPAKRGARLSHLTASIIARDCLILGAFSNGDVLLLSLPDYATALSQLKGNKDHFFQLMAKVRGTIVERGG
jgi:hypothetical protein